MPYDLLDAYQQWQDYLYDEFPSQDLIDGTERQGELFDEETQIINALLAGASLKGEVLA